MRRLPSNSRSKSAVRKHTGGSAALTGRGVDLKSASQRILQLEVEVFSRCCEAIDTPRALTCYLMARYGEWQQYLELSFPDPLLDTFADDYLVTEMLTKNPRLPIGVNRRTVAIHKFLDSEQTCKETNARLCRLARNPESDPKMSLQLFRLQEIISGALGPLTADKVERLVEASRFGPGATSCVSGSDVCLSRKYASDVFDATPRMLPYVRSLFGPHVSGEVTQVTASRVTTVPKNAKTDRTICIEPHANIYLQLGIGGELRRVLRRLGLQPDNQERNREMARTAVKRAYATIDLSAASDTIARKLVELLMPREWLHLLNVCRTDKTVIDGTKLDGQLLTLEKYSSMGNGFTWELESLIFWAVCKLHTDEDIGVFGDDLVIPISAVADVVESLKYFGFSTNAKKSFWQGTFRESCGTDWWHGLNVRPFFLKKQDTDIYDHEHYAIHIANSIRLYAHRRGDSLYCDRRFLRAWLYAKSRCGKYSRTYLSAGFGDDGLIRNFDEATPSRARAGGAGNHLWRAVVARRKPVDHKGTIELGAYYAALNKGSPDASRLRETYRKRLGRPSTKVVLVNDWYDLGPWI